MVVQPPAPVPTSFPDPWEALGLSFGSIPNFSVEVFPQPVLPAAPASGERPLDAELAELRELDATELPELPEVDATELPEFPGLEATDPPLVATDPDEVPPELSCLLDPDVPTLTSLEASGPFEDPDVPQPTATTTATLINSLRRRREPWRNSCVSTCIRTLPRYAGPHNDRCS